MGLSEDLKEIFPEVGALITIYKYGTGETFTEYGDFEAHTDAEFLTKDEWMSECTLAYDTNTAEGDLLIFDANGKKFIVLNLNSEIFENSVISKECIMYQCTNTATIKRLDGSTRNDDYEMVPNWIDVAVDIDVLFTGTTFDQRVIEERYGSFGKATTFLFLSKDIGIAEEDKVIIDGISYQALLVAPYTMPGVVICGMIKETRE